MKKLMLGAVALAALSGCATITRGTTDVLVIESEPLGAHVKVSPDGLECTTPCSLKLKRSGTYSLAIHKDGYEDVQTTVQGQIVGAGAAGMAGNVLVGGLIGVGVDAASGAMKDLKPNPVHVKLERLTEVTAVTQ